MELVLFDLEDGPSNLPSPFEVNELRCIAEGSGLSYTVHLPLDVRAGDAGDFDHPSVRKAAEIISGTADLTPRAYVLHLDGREVRGLRGTDPAVARWKEDSVRVLEHLARLAGARSVLALENLEGYPLAWVEEVTERCGTGRCIDVGHLWLDGIDAARYVERWLADATVIHLHGVQDHRDHLSLRVVQEDSLDAVVQVLLERPFTGVLTLEVFGREDFRSSVEALARSVERVRGKV